MKKDLLLLTCAAAAAVSCASPSAELKVRSTRSAPQIEGIAQAQAQLALGNSGMALEGFRKVLREQPGNVLALVGVAHSYEQMSRFDLARKWFETALAAAPDDRRVLAQFAAALKREGLVSEAQSVERELASGAPQPSLAASTADVAPAAADPAYGIGEVTVTLPEPVRVADVREISGAPKVRQVAAEQQVAGPRLERLSLGEVALVTRSESLWVQQKFDHAKGQLTVRWVELRPSTRLLNAARYQGLAARTRAQLQSRGWRRLAIGDAPATRANTVVLYPAGSRRAAERLAADLGFQNLRVHRGAGIVVLLGRDSVSKASVRRI